MIEEFKKDVALCSECFQSMTDKGYFESKIKAAHQVTVVSLTEVFTADEIDAIWHYVDPQMHECYKNSLSLCELFPERCQYCECMVYVPIGVEHAINKVGDKYVDVTFEMVLRENPVKSKDAYIVFGEYDAATAIQATASVGKYGHVFTYEYYKDKDITK